MLVALQNPIVFVADFIAPLVIALICCLRWGPNRGTLYALVPALVVVLGLFMVQVNPEGNPSGASRFDFAFSYMMFDGIYWVAAFLVGCAIGSVLWKRRGGAR
jgi:hypothetical protein